MLEVAIIGLGDRGTTYTRAFIQLNCKIVAFSDPNSQKRNKFALEFQLPSEAGFEDWRKMLKEISSNVVVISSPDKFHYEQAVEVLKVKRHLLLEKPMVSKFEDLQKLQKLALDANVITQVCHVLRYTNFYSLIKDNITKLGDIVSISMEENVSYYHYAHSFVRGNWHNREESSPFILAKCSHDLDLMYWYAGAPPKSVSSVGGRKHFKYDDTLPERCLDGCSKWDSCKYYAPDLYIHLIPLLHVQKQIAPLMQRLMINAHLSDHKIPRNPVKSNVEKYYGWPINIISEDSSRESKEAALKNTNYGKCVYRMNDHDIVDHQMVLIEFENGVTGTLSVHGFSPEEGRAIRINGTNGSLIGEFTSTKHKLIHYDSLSNKKIALIDTIPQQGHGGGDIQLVKSFVDAVKNRNSNLTPIKESLTSHFLAFIADVARTQTQTLNYKQFLLS